MRRITLYVAVDAAAITAWAISNKMNDAIYCMHDIDYKVSFYKRAVKHILLKQKQFRLSGSYSLGDCSYNLAFAVGRKGVGLRYSVETL